MMSPPAIVIRAATPTDAAAILQVHQQSIRVLGSEVYSLAEVESWAAGLVPERYVKAMNEGSEVFIVAAVADGALAGFCSFKDDEVKGLYVAPDWVRRGDGSALLRQAEATIAAGGHRFIRIVASLSGQAFYEHHGYRAIERRDWKSRGGLVSAALAMEKALPAPAVVNLR
jgi:predicted N-acetyltransferase YhbS